MSSTGAGTKIHPSAIVSPKAELAAGVEVGPFSIIAEDVQIGRGTRIGPHVQIDRWTVIGEDNEIFFGCTLGNPSKDRKYGGWRSYARIGDRNVLREYVSITRATPEDRATTVGDDNLLMNWVSLAHDCVVGSRVIMANLATLGGHVTIEDDCRIGGQSGFLPFVRIGRMSMAGAVSKFDKDVPPFSVAAGNPARIHGLNLIGLRTSKIHPMKDLPRETIRRLKQSYQILFRSKLRIEEAVARVRAEVESCAEVEDMLRFVETSERGIAI